MFSPNIFNTIFVFPILNLLVIFYKFFLYVHLPGAFGFAIIALTVFIRLLFYPFFGQQIRTTKKLQELKPHLDTLSEKHKKDPKKLQEEQMRLYKEAGINPATGCLLALINIPIFYALYSVFFTFLHSTNQAVLIKSINSALYWPILHISYLNFWFFGFNLALAPQKAGVWYYYLVPVVTALLQYFAAPGMGAAAPVPTNESVDGKGKPTEAKKQKSGDFQQAMNMQMKYLFPLMIGWFAFTLPVGLALYWNVVSIFTIIQYKQHK